MRSILPWLRLCRIPAVCTALADIIAGHYCATGFHFRVAPRAASVEFFCLCGASAGLYLAGMVFNDVFDVAQDTRERPSRPIPSGQIRWSQALVFALVLMTGGLAFAAAAGAISFQISVVLAVCILAYDSVLKRTWLGPLGMGTCRFFNIVLGASAGARNWEQAMLPPPGILAIVMLLYITGVTWFARTEARISSKKQLASALALMNLAIAFLLLDGFTTVMIPWEWPYHAALTSLAVVAATMGIFFHINRHALPAVRDPVPSKVQPAIGKLLLAVIFIDATFILSVNGVAGWGPALAVLALIIPMLLLRKLIAVT